MRKGCGLVVPKQKRQRAKHLHISIGMSVFKKCSQCCTAFDVYLSKDSSSQQLSFFTYRLHLFIAARIIKSAVHNFWNLGRKWLNMVSVDACTCIHQHYFLLWVIVDLLFCLFVWRRMRPVAEYINSMATKCCTTVWTHQISAVETAFMNSSTVTAQMLRPIK